jgi:drug/metabolite transporter (DMT)-like permease
MTIVNSNNSWSARFALQNLIIGAVMISFSGVWVKVSEVTPTVSAFYRVFFGGIILLSAVWLRSEFKWKGVRHLLLGSVCGILLAIDLCLYHHSIHYVGPGLGTILPNFQVFILAAIGLIFFKEKIRRLFILSILLAFLGLFLIVGMDWGNATQLYKIGVYYGLAAAGCYAVYLLSLRRLQSDQIGVSIFSGLTVVSLVTAAILAVVVCYTGDSFRIPDLQSFLALAALGLFSQSLGWIIITNALPHVRASLSGFVLLLQPALAFIWDVWFFDRQTDWINWLGVCAALLAIYLGTAKPSSPK